MAPSTDGTSAAVVTELCKRHGDGAVQLIRAHELLAGAAIRHEVGPGGVETRLTFRSSELNSGTTDVVLNRIERFDAPRFSHVDRGYAAIEMYAVFLSALRTIHGLVNRPHVRGLAGPRMPALEWRHLAAGCGLRVQPYGPNSALVVQPTHSCDVTVIGRQLLGAPSEEIARGCAALARLVRCGLLRCHFVRAEGGAEWAFADADPVPTLEESAVGLLATHIESLR